MRYFSADIIFPIHRSPIRNGILLTDDHGKILGLIDPSQEEIPDSLPIEKFKGILCPGFVNTHCHLELSHLKGRMTQRKTLPFFISEIIGKRNAEKEMIIQAMNESDAEMYREGIVSVGDISNSSDSIDIKKDSKIQYYTFIELFDIFPDRAEKVFDGGLSLLKEFTDSGMDASLVPHAPYTVSERLMKMIYLEAERANGLLSIHNQETASENEMFENGTGALIEKLKDLTGAYTAWNPLGISSLKSLIGMFPSDIPTQLVHNTFTSNDDIVYALKKIPDLYWCLCVNANLYIENIFPDINLMKDKKCKITIGTDSYASNTSLSVLVIPDSFDISPGFVC